MKRFSRALLLAGAWLLAAQQQPPFVLPESVEMKADLVYVFASAGNPRDLHLDLFLPKSGDGPFPGIVYIHGGGWSGGNKAAFRRQAARMATKGFVGACIEYRLSGEAQYPAAIYDAKAAVRWMRANRLKYNIDPDRIGAAGGSAGGHLAALLGVTGGSPEHEGGAGNAGFSSRVQAVAAFNPAVDLVSFGKTGPDNAQNSVSKFLGATYAEKPELWAKASPLTFASRHSAPTLFLHGDKDATVPIQQSRDMLEKLKAGRVETELFVGEGGEHGFFNRPPHYEPALKKMEEFFMRVLKKP